MSDYKFDCFYYMEDQSIHPLSDIANLSDEIYAIDYADKMLCPLCCNPHLTRVKRNGTIFLRTYPNQHHVEIDGEMCIYEHNTASQRIVVSHIEKLHDKRRLQQSLGAVVRMMLREPGQSHQTRQGTDFVGNNPLIIHRKCNGTNVMEVIPHYSLLNWGPNIPQEQLLIAYGRRIFIYVYTPPSQTGDGNSSETKTSATYLRFYRTNTMDRVLSSMRKPDNIDIKSGYYRFAAVGYCVFHNNYYNFRPFNWYDSIYVQPVE